MRHDESILQKECVRWFRLTHQRISRLLFAVPNGGRRDKVTAAIMKSEGVVAGVADLILLVPNLNHSCLCLEMKTPQGRQSDSQKQWQRDAVRYGCARYEVVRSFDEFKDIVDGYLADLNRKSILG